MGLHHTAYYCADFEAALKQAEQKGQAFEVVQEFIFEDGNPYEIYIAPKGVENPMFVQLMFKALEPMFVEMEKAAATWNGENPERNALDLLPQEMRPPQEF
ncbi:MAG: hypothetical protein HZB24_01280 [Desulfobacterales bacterium]|nr:hypothetical protein [Desulfobacterales bacterium]